MLGGAHLGKLPIEPGEVGEQVGAIVLDRAHHVVRAALLDHAPGGVVAGVQRVEGHDAPGEVEPGEQGTNGRDLVALVLYRLLSETIPERCSAAATSRCLAPGLYRAAPRMYSRRWRRGRCARPAVRPRCAPRGRARRGPSG